MVAMVIENLMFLFIYFVHLNPMPNWAVIELSTSFLITMATVVKETEPK